MTSSAGSQDKNTSDECWYNQVLKQAPGNLTCTSLRDKTELETKLLSATAPADDTTFLNMLSILLVITWYKTTLP